MRLLPLRQATTNLSHLHLWQGCSHYLSTKFRKLHLTHRQLVFHAEAGTVCKVYKDGKFKKFFLNKKVIIFNNKLFSRTCRRLHQKCIDGLLRCGVLESGSVHVLCGFTRWIVFVSFVETCNIVWQQKNDAKRLLFLFYNERKRTCFKSQLALRRGKVAGHWLFFLAPGTLHLVLTWKSCEYVFRVPVELFPLLLLLRWLGDFTAHENMVAYSLTWNVVYSLSAIKRKNNFNLDHLSLSFFSLSLSTFPACSSTVVISWVQRSFRQTTFGIIKCCKTCSNCFMTPRVKDCRTSLILTGKCILKVGIYSLIHLFAFYYYFFYQITKVQWLMHPSSWSFHLTTAQLLHK